MLSYIPVILCYKSANCQRYMYIHMPTTTVSPNTATDGSTTTISATNEPIATTTNDFLTTINMSTTTREGTKDTSTITDAQQSTTDNATKAVTCSQSMSTTGIITGVAIGGILLGALITVLVTLIIVAIVCLIKKKQSTLTQLAMNRISGKEDKINDNIGMRKDLEEPVYSVILPNPAGSHHQVVTNRNECYGTSYVPAAL